MTKHFHSCVEPLISVFLSPLGSQTPVLTVSSAQTLQACLTCSRSAVWVCPLFCSLPHLPGPGRPCSARRVLEPNILTKVIHLHLGSAPEKTQPPVTPDMTTATELVRGRAGKVIPNAFDGSPAAHRMEARILNKAPPQAGSLFPLISHPVPYELLCFSKSTTAPSLAAGLSHVLSLLRMFFLTCVGLFSKSQILTQALLILGSPLSHTLQGCLRCIPPLSH